MHDVNAAHGGYKHKNLGVKEGCQGGAVGPFGILDGMVGFEKETGKEHIHDVGQLTSSGHSRR
eukprot:1144846-Pelagomonas_calceolata.AAC.3